jgi:hypothetical protein
LLFSIFHSRKFYSCKIISPVSSAAATAPQPLKTMEQERQKTENCQLRLSKQKNGEFLITEHGCRLPPTCACIRLAQVLPIITEQQSSSRQITKRLPGERTHPALTFAEYCT